MNTQHKKRWALPVPMHLSQDDHSAEAAELRLHLYQSAFHRSGGRGFRFANGTGSKRRHPRMGWGKQFNRVEALFLAQKYGERHAQ